MVETLQVIQLLTAAATLGLMFYGIDSWRREHSGRRQIDLAEEALALFYEAADAIDYMRHPASLGHEYEGIEKAEGETEESFRARRNASIVFVRYNLNQETFAKLRAMRYRFMTAFGTDSAKPFDELQRITGSVKSSASMLARLWQHKSFVNEAAQEQHFKAVDRYEALFWDGHWEDDPIKPKVAAMIQQIEGICRPIIESKGTLFGLLNSRIERGRSAPSSKS